MLDPILPWIASKSDVKHHIRIMRTTGIMESALYEKIDAIINLVGEMVIANANVNQI